MTEASRKAMFAKLGLRAEDKKLLSERDLRGGIKLKRIPPPKGLEDLGIFHGQTTGYDVSKKKKVKIQNESLFLTKNNRFMIKGESPLAPHTTVARFV